MILLRVTGNCSFSRSQVTTTHATTVQSAEASNLPHTSSTKEFSCRHHTCHIVLESQTAFLSTVSQQSVQKPIGYSVGNSKGEPSAQDRQERKYFRLYSPTWIYALLGRGPISTEGCCELQHRKFPIQSDIGGQGVVKSQEQGFLRRLVGWRISAFVWVSRGRLRICLRLSVPV